MNRRYGETRQALYSYKLAFPFPTDAGAFGIPAGPDFTVEDVPFRDKYFPAGNKTIPVKTPAKSLIFLTFRHISDIILNC